MEEGLDQKKNKTEEDDEAALGELRVLLERLLKLDDEKETIEIKGKNKELEETLLNDEVDVAKKENAIIIVETGDMVEDIQGKDKRLGELIKGLGVEEGKRSDELKCLMGVLMDEEKKIDKAVTKSLAIESDIVEIETKKSRFEDKRKEMETEKKYLDNQVFDNSELVVKLKKKIINIEDMKSEMEVLDETLKEAEATRLEAENEYKLLSKVQEEKLKLDDENLELSVHVHDYESQVHNCKTDIYAAQDELKKKTKDLCLLESKVLELNACKRNKLKEFEKIRKFAETKGK